MAVVDTAVLKIDSGNYFLAPVGTARISDYKAPAVGWTSIGHTSIEEILSAESEGGEATILGTLQKKTLRTAYSPRTENFTINLQQFDEAALKLYFGSNMVEVDAEMLGVAQDPTPTKTAFQAVYFDGNNVFSIYAAEAEIIRADDWSLEDTESLSGLPIKITPIAYQSNEWALGIIPIHPYVAP